MCRLLVLLFGFLGVVCGDVAWEDSPILTRLWETISRRETNQLLDLLTIPGAAEQRAADGRGALFWAYEFKNEEALALLMGLKVSEDMKDANGLTPKETFSPQEQAHAFVIRGRSLIQTMMGKLEARARELANANNQQPEESDEVVEVAHYDAEESSGEERQAKEEEERRKQLRESKLKKLKKKNKDEF